MTGNLETLETLRKLGSPFASNSPIISWKNEGKKVFAFQCTYVPEEIIYAAGILPIRLIGDSRQSGLGEADAYMYINTCSFIRSCLQSVLKKQYDFLDGFVAGATCDCSRRLMDIWAHYKYTPFTHIISVPRKMTERSYEFYEAEIREFVQNLENFTATRITAEEINRATAIYNRRRELLKQLNELRKMDEPPVTGAEVMDILNASSCIPPEQFNALLGNLLEEINQQKRGIRKSYRILVNGSPLNSPQFIDTIEQMDAVVVIDELCTGVRYWWETVDPAPDPIKAISRRYLHNFACPRMEPSEDRIQRVLKLVRDYRVDAVITQMIRYCTPQTMEQPLVRDALEKVGVPVLELDVEYGATETGQIKTRVQAFMEMIKRSPVG